MKYNQLYEEIKKKGSFLCVGLDTDLGKIPDHIKKMPDPIYQFNKAIIDCTSRYCVAYKPNTAFYEAEGSLGWRALEMTVEYIRKNYPSQFIIADAKRGDIGNTSNKYAEAFFKRMDFDAITLSPYMGSDSIDPFLKFEDKWVIILAMTSNKSAEQFESLEVQAETPLYKKIIQQMTNITPHHKEKMMFVVGATRPEQLKEIRTYCPDNFLLIPGVGAQGGSLDDVCKYGLNDHCGLLVNASRSIIYASSGIDFAEKAEEEARKIRNQMIQKL